VSVVGGCGPPTSAERVCWLRGPQCANEEHERVMLQSLKQQFGAQFTSKMEGMVTDLQLARDNQQVRQRHHPTLHSELLRIGLVGFLVRGDREWLLGRWTTPTLPRRACSPRHGLRPCKGGVSDREWLLGRWTTPTLPRRACSPQGGGERASRN
jgi:hypothetical protein